MMCFAVYIGTDKEIETGGEFIPDQTEIYFENLTEEEEISLRPKFSKKHIYYVGSDTGCSCGFQYDSLIPEEENIEYGNSKKPAIRLLDLIEERTRDENVEFYCCWEGDWNEPIETREEIDIRDISINSNYFGLTEKQFIIFRKRPDTESTRHNTA